MRRPASILYGGPDDESFSAHSAIDYLAEQWALDQLRVGVEVDVAKYRRKPFQLERFESAIECVWDGILSELEGEYATDDARCGMSPAEEAQREKDAARELDLLRDLRALVLRTQVINPGALDIPTPADWARVVAAADAASGGARWAIPCPCCGRTKDPEPGEEAKTLNCIGCKRPVPNRLAKEWP